MKKQKKKIELPLAEPLYSTYHYQGPGTATLVNNPSIRNWYLNQVMILTCTNKFLNGFTTPEISMAESSWSDNPFFDKKWYAMQFLEGHTHFVIRKLLDAGYYVCFNGIDDYYVEGKSWYHERHFNHDGCICGYNQENKTYGGRVTDFHFNSFIVSKRGDTQTDEVSSFNNGKHIGLVTVVDFGRGEQTSYYLNSSLEKVSVFNPFVEGPAQTEFVTKLKTV